MQSVFIYVIGSCNAQTREGSAIVLTEQGSEKRLQTFDYRDTTANRCIIHGLIDGVQQLDAPHHVVLVTSTPVGVVSASKGKGANQDLINELLRELTARQCTYCFDFRKGEGDALNKYVVNHYG
ncbi:hypothetical protein OJE16_21925 [Pantoea tagorei]